MGVLNIHQDRVREEWIDYNGHLSEAYYVLTFGDATDALYDYVGMGPSYRNEMKRSVYTLESHIRYLDEVALGKLMEFNTQLISFDEKRMHFTHEMYVEGRLRATTELIAMHLETSEGGGVIPFPQEVMKILAGLIDGDKPDYVGRSVMMLKNN